MSEASFLWSKFFGSTYTLANNQDGRREDRVARVHEEIFEAEQNQKKKPG